MLGLMAALAQLATTARAFVARAGASLPRPVGGVHECVCSHEQHLADPTHSSLDAMGNPPMRSTSCQPLLRVAVTQKRWRVVPAQRVRASEQLQRRRAWMRVHP